MSNLFGLNKPNTNLKKNVFDLSEKSLFSSSCGMLLPCMVKELNPGEKVELNVGSYVRTQPLNTAAFVRVRQYYHFFFVPYKQLWRGWDNFINGVDYKTSAWELKGSGYNRIPKLDIGKALASLIRQEMILDVSWLESHKAKYERKEKGVTFGSAESYFDVLDGLEKTPTFGNGKYGRDEFGIEYFRGMSRLLDMLCYGFSDGRVDRGHPTISSLSDVIDAYRAGRYPGIDTLEKLAQDLEKTGFSVNPFRLLAYQKIYSDFYKRDDYETTNPYSFNIDDLGENGFVTDRSKSDAMKRLLEVLRIRYRWSPKDYFTGVVPTELFGVNSSLSDFSKRSNTLEFAQNKLQDLADGAVLNYGRGENRGIGMIDTGSSPISTRTIRSAFAIEKLLRLTRRAGGHDYISQTAAHYGFTPPQGRGDKVQFIGGYTLNVDINEVVTTATTQEGETGQTKGQGIGSLSSSPNIDFTAPEHGLIMCVTSFVPDLDYDSIGMDRFNTKFERGDYFHPELQDLGLQPLYGYELRNPLYTRGYAEEGRSISGSADKTILTATRNQILGFVPMYSEYKTSFDRLHGEFRNGKGYSAWSANSLVDYDRKTRSGVVVSTLKINPRCLDRIMTLMFDGSEVTDQFMISAQFYCKVIRPMSITGQNL